MKRFTHDADLRGMVVLRSLGFQLVPFKLHRFRKQRLINIFTIVFRYGRRGSCVVGSCSGLRGEGCR
ncbi:hypothetical protein [Aeromonas salmonicida]|uniref:hypothetical protein n=1 Tax=Aeromonas salmonicida TaxID=645 RepID=UPI003D73D510